MQENTNSEYCQLYLITDNFNDEQLINELTAAASHCPIAAVLFQLPGPIPTDMISTAVNQLQAHNIAVLIADDYDLVKAVNADGVHLTSDDPSALSTARTHIGDSKILGVMAGSSRHSAMIAGERGASYMAIEPTEGNQDQTEEREDQTVMDLEYTKPPTIEWWSTLFNSPVVAWNIKTPDQTLAAWQKGAEFIAVDLSALPEDQPLSQSLSNLLTPLSAADNNDRLEQ